MGRWSPRPLPGARADDDPLRLADELDDVDEQAETLAIARAHVARLDAQLTNDQVTDPALLARLQRDRAYWQHAIDEATLDGHWASGEGDRTLF